MDKYTRYPQNIIPPETINENGMHWSDYRILELEGKSNVTGNDKDDYENARAEDAYMLSMSDRLHVYLHGM